jgi:heme A synthase
MRLSADGLSCQPWPQCYAEAMHAQQQGVSRTVTVDNHVVIARVLHRLFAILRR